MPLFQCVQFPRPFSKEQSDVFVWIGVLEREVLDGVRHTHRMEQVQAQLAITQKSLKVTGERHF
jgi:predicted alpha/beta superfamily hydrolase